jgi:hypothetical protein
MVLALGAAALGACSDSSATGVPKGTAAGTGPEFLTAAQLVGVPGPASTAGTAISYPLYAGGGGGGTGTLVGHVLVWSTLVSGNTYAIHVTYSMLSGFCLTGTHLQIALQPSGVPQKNGNPIPGQFDNKHDDACTSTDSYTVNFDLGASDNGVVIAAHAGTVGVGSPGFAGAQFVSGASGSTMAATLTGRRSGNVSGFSAASGSLVLANKPGTLWDDVINADPSGNGVWLETHGAKFVWETAAVSAGDAVVGSVIQASAVINVPIATPGTFRITCDNGYRVDLNGTTITTADGATAGLGTSLSNTFAANIATETNLKQANVNGDGWETVPAYAVNLLAGNNTFTIYGVNEYMDTDDSHTGFPGFGAGLIGFRAAAPDPHGTPTLNPAGCIFGVDVAAIPPVPSSGEETAWGAPNGFTGATTGANNLGGNFTGANWATWFAYKVR